MAGFSNQSFKNIGIKRLLNIHFIPLEDKSCKP